MSEAAIAIEELRKQREFLLLNKWVNGDPRRILAHNGVGCLVLRCPTEQLAAVVASDMARQALRWALADMGYPVNVFADGRVDNIPQINDGLFQHAGDAIEALERAMLVVKESFGEQGEDG